MTTGQRIAELRRKCGYSQIYVAEKLRVSRQAVSRWEMDAAAPDTYNLIALAELLGVTVEYIALGKEAVDEKPQSEPELAQKSGMRLLNIILITLAVWAGVGVLLYVLLSAFKWWNESNTFFVLTYIVVPFPFALMGKKLRGLDCRKMIWLYFAGFMTSLFVAAVCFGAFAIYIVTSLSWNTLDFILFDGGGKVSFFFWGLDLIQLAVMIPVFSRSRVNIPWRILLTVLSAFTIIFMAIGVSELLGNTGYYINTWWWTAVCVLLYCAVGLIHLLTVKKHAKKLDTTVGNRV